MSKICVLADEVCAGFDHVSLDCLLSKLSRLFSNKPGECVDGVCKVEILEGSEIVSKQPHQVPIHLKEAVKTEIDCLLEEGIIEASNLSWSSPVVPLCKP